MFFGILFWRIFECLPEQKHWFHPESPEIGEKFSTWVLQAAGWTQAERGSGVSDLALKCLKPSQKNTFWGRFLKSNWFCTILKPFQPLNPFNEPADSNRFWASLGSLNEVAQKRAALEQERLERQMALERAMVRRALGVQRSTGFGTWFLCCNQSRCYWKWPCIVDLPLKMVIFHSYVSLPEGRCLLALVNDHKWPF